MAQYLSVARLISKTYAHPVIVNHRTVNNGLLRDITKFSVGEGSSNGRAQPVFVLDFRI
jgi:hypothetical protein